MTTAAEGLLVQALQLSAEDRALLAADLLASLDDESADEASVDRSWSQETDRRARMLDAGEATLVTWDHLVERIDGRRTHRSSG